MDTLRECARLGAEDEEDVGEVEEDVSPDPHLLGVDLVEGVEVAHEERRVHGKVQPGARKGLAGVPGEGLRRGGAGGGGDEDAGEED
eukprot:756529-Hanusia_phi.AAC.4